MKKSRCLGLIGGLGVGATVYYYEKLAHGCESRGFTLDSVITNAYVPRVFEYAEIKDPNSLAEYLNGYIRRMKAAGAEMAVIPAVTPHYCLKELRAISPLPVLSIFDPVARELEHRGARRVALFGTRFVIASKLFGAVEGVEFVQPKAEEVDLIHNTYAELATSGEGSAEKHELFTGLAKTLIQRDGVDVFLLAGTDLTLLFNEENTDFPYVDCAAVHVAEILKKIVE